jgi:hypothetical protein
MCTIAYTTTSAPRARAVPADFPGRAAAAALRVRDVRARGARNAAAACAPRGEPWRKDRAGECTQPSLRPRGRARGARAPAGQLPARRDLARVAGLGLCLYFNQLFYIIGIDLSGVVVATCMQPTIPVFTAAIAVALHLEAGSAQKLAGIGLAVGGSICMARPPAPPAPGRLGWPGRRRPGGGTSSRRSDKAGVAMGDGVEHRGCRCRDVDSKRVVWACCQCRACCLGMLPVYDNLSSCARPQLPCPEDCTACEGRRTRGMS